MKLLGKDISSRELLDNLESRLRARGLLPQAEDGEPAEDTVEPRVEPVPFNLTALEEHADPTRPLPLHTHRSGAGQAVVLAKWAFRKTCQVFINEALSRQRLFNGHVRDSYAQLTAEVERLRREVERLRGEAAARDTPQAAKPPTRPTRSSAARETTQAAKRPTRPAPTRQKRKK